MPEGEFCFNYAGGYSITKNSPFDQAFDTKITEITTTVSELKRLVINDADQSAQAKEIEHIASQLISVLNECRDDVKENRVDAAQNRSKGMYAKLRLLIDDLQKHIETLLAFRRVKLDTSETQKNTQSRQD